VSQPLRILHLEDSRIDAELVRNRLEMDGIDCEITVAASREAFEQGLLAGPWDLIFCDYNIPGYDGIAALNLSKKLCPKVPVIMISGGLSEYEGVDCIHLGAADYVLKQALVRLPSAVKRTLEVSQESLLRERAEMRFRGLMEFAPDAIVIVDEKGEMILVNSQAEVVFGYGREELIGKPMEILVPSRYRTSHSKHVSEFIQKGISRKMAIPTELFAIRRDGIEIPVEILLSPLAMPDEHLTIAAIRDMSERKRLEAQVSRAQRMESIGAFAGNIAHDLNNALAPVLMSLEILRSRNPESSELLSIIDTGARRGAEMLRQLLVFSKGSFVDPKPVDSSALLTEIETAVRVGCPEGIELRVSASPGLRTMLGDVTQLHQALLNLCTNARDAMPNGGTLTLTAENVDVTKGDAEGILGSRPGRFLRWSVSDTGTGIPPEVLDRVFEPFFTTKGHGKGTGLGLSIVAGIVKSHRGFVHIYSAPNCGSTFSIYIPITETLREERDPPKGHPVELKGNQAKLLIVDDSEAILAATAEIMSSMDFHVLTATNGHDALALASENAADLRAVVTDLHMPNMDGHEFVQRLRAVLPELAVIVTSGNLSEETVIGLKELGVVTFLEKPFSQDTLTSALKSVLTK